ncbi:MAG: ANTAR domain-containing response regulator [Christensenellales bacterium]
MQSVLIVTATHKSEAYLRELLAEQNFEEIAAKRDCDSARRLLLSRDFDLCIINAPLEHEFGDTFAMQLVQSRHMQVIIAVRWELFDQMSAKLDEVGIYTVPKPLDRALLQGVLRLANIAFNRLSILQKENIKLKQSIQDVKLIDRAKILLVEYLKMSEDQAHKYIEKQAMDMRITRKAVAKNILKTYQG